MFSFQNIGYGFRLAWQNLRYGLADARNGTLLLAPLIILALAGSNASANNIYVSMMLGTFVFGAIIAIFCRRCFDLQEQGQFSWASLTSIPASVWWRAGQVLLIFCVLPVIAIVLPADIPAKAWIFVPAIVLLSAAGWTAMPFAMNEGPSSGRPFQASIASLKQAWEPVLVMVALFFVAPLGITGYLIFGVVKPLVRRLVESAPEMSFTPYALLFVLTTFFVLLMIHASVATYRAITGRLVI